MRHARCERRLSEYADETLPPHLRAGVEAHLTRCSACREELAALRGTVQLLSALGSPEEPPPQLGNRVMARIAAGEADPGWWGRWGGRWQRWMDSTAGPPLLTAAVGLTLLVLVQAVEVQVTLPGLAPGSAGLASASADRAAPESVAAAAAAPAAAAPLAARRRGVAGIPGMPPLAACLRGGAPDCARWHAWHVGLGMREPSVFLREVENVPDRARERWLAELSRFAAHQGSASVLAARLRESGDPRAQGLAARFERTAAAPRR